MISFNMIVFIYIPIITFLYLISHGVYYDLKIKYDKRYEVIKVKYSFVDTIKISLAAYIMVVVWSIIPCLNLLILISNVLSTTYEERVIEERIKRGTLKRKEVTK